MPGQYLASVGAARPRERRDLFRQPGGFEGLTLVEKAANAHGPAGVQLDDPRPIGHRPRPRSPGHSLHIAEYQNAVAKISDVVALN
jgi:hypothetical protein